MKKKNNKTHWNGIPYEVEQILYGVSIFLVIGLMGHLTQGF